MKGVGQWRPAKLPHEQRVAIREVMLRGAAREYVENANSPEEDAAAAVLHDAAIEYAAAVLQRSAAEPQQPPARKHTEKTAHSSKEPR